MPTRIFCLLASPDEAQGWQLLAKKRGAEADFFATTSVTALVQACGGEPPEVLVVDLAVPGAPDLISDVQISRPDHHLLALTDEGHFWPSALPAPAARLRKPFTMEHAAAALDQVIELAQAAEAPPAPAVETGHVIHQGETGEEHLEWLQAVPRLLVVDDNAMILRFAEAALAREFPDHAVITVETGREGMDCARHLHPRLILLDYSLPDFNGDSFAEQLRSDPELATTPVVLMSGYNEKLQDVAVTHPNVVGTLAKPFKAEDLFRVLRRAMAFKPPAPSPLRPLGEMTTRILRQQRPLVPPTS